MAKKETKRNIQKILLDAHKKGVKDAIDLSARTGIPLVVERGGKIQKLKPEYKYVKVQVAAAKSVKKSKKK